MGSWLALVAWLICLHVILYLRLPRLDDPMVQAYLVQPLLWLATAGLVLWLWRRHARPGALSTSRRLVAICALAGALQLALYAAVGVLRGWGPSPYTHSLTYTALSLWYMAARLLGVELARWYLLTAMRQQRPRLGFAAAWLLPFLFQVGLWSLLRLDSPAAAASLGARSLLPAATENLLATFMVGLGGPAASLAYRGLLALFAILSPALPKLSLFTAALLAIAAPLIGWLFVSGVAEARPTTAAQRL